MPQVKLRIFLAYLAAMVFEPTKISKFIFVDLTGFEELGPIVRVLLLAVLGAVFPLAPKSQRQCPIANAEARPPPRAGLLLWVGGQYPPVHP